LTEEFSDQNFFVFGLYFRQQLMLYRHHRLCLEMVQILSIHLHYYYQRAQLLQQPLDHLPQLLPLDHLMQLLILQVVEQLKKFSIPHFNFPKVQLIKTKPAPKPPLYHQFNK
jgi:hypothetical protein